MNKVNRQKKATHEVLKRRGDIENVPSGSHVPNINQSHEISHQLNKGTTDSLKKLIEKQQGDGSTEDTIIQRIQTNPFSYDIILLTSVSLTTLQIFVAHQMEITNLLFFGTLHLILVSHLPTMF